MCDNMTDRRVRDLRQPEWYRIDNAFLREGWGAIVGASGIAVYNAVVIHARNETQKAFPSIRLIGKLTNLSRPTVTKGIKALEDLNILSVKRVNGEHHEYHLLDKSIWGPGKEIVGTQQGDCQGPGKELSPNKTKDNKTNEQAGSGKPANNKLSEGQREFLSLFGAKRYKTRIQRDTILELEEEYSTDRLIELARWAAKRGLNVGSAVVAVEGALKKQAKQNGRTAMKVGR